MRVVLDTNIVVSGLLWRGTPRDVLDVARRKLITIFTSTVLLDELADVFSPPHLAPVIAANSTSPTFLMQRYAMLAQLVVPAEIGRVVERDIDDDAVIARCALGAGAELIVSGDPHLLNLKTYQGIRIVPPAEALALITRP